MEDFNDTDMISKIVREILDDNKKLREMLWLRHGCTSTALYGDDGEMQCHQCEIDFRRNLADVIETKFIEIGKKAFQKSQIVVEPREDVEVIEEKRDDPEIR